MSNKRRAKQLKRNNRKYKKEFRESKIERLTRVCTNCEGEYRIDKFTNSHRPGICDTPKEDIAGSKARLMSRNEEYEKAEGGVLACDRCGSSHNADERMIAIWEGVVVWAGCEECVDVYVDDIDRILEACANAVRSKS